MGEVVYLRPQRVTTDEPFGGCPKCGKCDGFLNVARNHWAVCDAHKTTWSIGSNLFSGWLHETEADWQRSEYRLAHYSIVEPICPEPTEAERRAMDAPEMSDAEFNTIMDAVFPLD